MAKRSPAANRQQSHTSGPGLNHIASLTGLRGFAAVAVVAVHASGLTAYPWFGLHTFGPITLFVLSGFLLFQPWSRWIVGRGPQPDLERYAQRRLLRIFPAYLVALFLVALVYPPSRPPSIEQWLLSATLTQTASPVGLRPGLEHAWSLGTELTWYVAVPLVGLTAFALSARARLRPVVAMTAILAASVAITAAWRVYTSNHTQDLSTAFTASYWLPAYLVCFVAGSWLSHVLFVDPNGGRLRRSMEWFAQRPGVVAASALVIGGVANSRLGGGWGWVPSTPAEQSLRFVLTTLLAALLVVGLAAAPRPTFLTSLFSHRGMVAVGRWSYSLYLWHLPVREILARYVSIPDGFLGMLLWFGMVLAVSLPLAAASYAFVERPALRMSRTLTQRSGLRETP